MKAQLEIRETQVHKFNNCHKGVSFPSRAIDAHTALAFNCILQHLRFVMWHFRKRKWWKQFLLQLRSSGKALTESEKNASRRKRGFYVVVFMALECTPDDIDSKNLLARKTFELYVHELVAQLKLKTALLSLRSRSELAPGPRSNAHTEIKMIFVDLQFSR